MAICRVGKGRSKSGSHKAKGRSVDRHKSKADRHKSKADRHSPGYMKAYMACYCAKKPAACQ